MRCGTSTCFTASTTVPEWELVTMVSFVFLMCMYVCIYVCMWAYRCFFHTHLYTYIHILVLGFCICLDGYYGEDCSNTSCPVSFSYIHTYIQYIPYVHTYISQGTFCYYDQTILQQFCYHGCQAGTLKYEEYPIYILKHTYIHIGYNHTDNDTYVPYIPKVACSLNTMNSFELNGMQTYIHAYIYTVHTYIHIYIYTYIHTYQ